ncbi:MAG: hypothetical protein ACP5VQ_05645 [Phycisphaerae bacterium]
MVAYYMAAARPGTAANITPRLRVVTTRESRALAFPVTADRRVATTKISTVHTGPYQLCIAGQPMAIRNGYLRFTGTLHTLGKNFIVAALGHFDIGATKLAWSATKPPTISTTGLVVQGHIHFWHDTKSIAHLHIQHGVATFNTLRMKTVTLIAGKISWSLRHDLLTATAITATWNHAMITASGTDNSASGVGSVVIAIPRFQQQRFFAMLAPQRVNIQGLGNMIARLTFNAAGHITGSINLTGLNAGYLQLHQVPLLREVLAGTYGQAMAGAMADDLHDYPFKQERVRVLLTQTGMTFKMDFLRGPGNPMHLKPRTVIIDGKTMLFRARDLKSVHLTIPVRNLTIRKLLAFVQRLSGVSTTR